MKRVGFDFLDFTIFEVVLPPEEAAMLTTTFETTMWQRNLASVIRSGLIDRAEVVDLRGLHAVVGVYKDGSLTAPLAKYGDLRRAEAAVAVIQNLAELSVPVEAN